jgi:hypothetical protein
MYLTEAQIRQYDEEGYLFFPNLFSAEEIALLREEVEAAQTTTGAWSQQDRGATTKAMALWTRPGKSAYDLLPGLPRLVEPTRQLLGEEVFHWHSKFIFKAPRTGAPWKWHQDYGYWHGDGCPTEKLLSAMVFIDEARPDNGCLNLMVGAHKLGRLEHVPIESGTDGKQIGMRDELIEELKKTYEVRPMVGEPGSVVLWHSNAPHASSANRSEHPRLAVIVAYNAMSNAPVDERGVGQGKPVPIVNVPDDALFRWKAERAAHHS